MRRFVQIPLVTLVSIWAAGSLCAQLPEGIVDTQDPATQPPTPAESLAMITAAEGFEVTLYAAEPDVAQPIAINFDDRGRLWVAESFSYIEWKRNGRDRILIFEDSDNDGTFDKRTVFWDQGNHVSGFQVGFGGVWICDAPNLIFIPDADRDDVPDSDPQIVLDGWTTEAEHNFFNGLTWGPDGWLYGRHGIKKPSLVGKPGTPESERLALSSAIWRYHPVRESFEVYAEGTINPWGLDWNQEGQAFITTSVIDHLWHLVPGARFARWEGQGTAIYPHAYDLMKPASDHRHWQGGETERRKQDGHEHEGGGHSHCGLMIYQADAWPEAFRGRAFFSNVLGQRINMDQLTRRFSTYTASHGEDLLQGNNAWFRVTDLKQGPHGEMMMAEWTDFGECHDRDGVHRSSGRIYRVSYGKVPAAEKFDVGSMPTGKLLDLLTHENAWWRRHALRNLFERAAGGEFISKTAKRQLIDRAKEAPVRDAVTAVQALHTTSPDGDTGWMEEIFESGSEDAVRAQIIGLAFTDGEPLTAERTAWLESIIPEESSPLVQLWMAAALQGISVNDRWRAADRLAEVDISPDDENLILMRWYGIEPLAAQYPDKAIKMALADGHRYLSQSIARRITTAGHLPVVLKAIHGNQQAPSLDAVLQGLLAGLPGRFDMPREWKDVSAILRDHPYAAVRRSAFQLAHRFGDPAAEKEMVSRVLNTDMAADERLELLTLLVSSRSTMLAPHVDNLVLDADLGDEAIRAVAVFPQADSARRLMESLDDDAITPPTRTAILETLASRSEFADVLTEAFLAGEIERDEIPNYLARQIAAISKRGKEFAKSWGLNATDAKAKEKLMQKWKAHLSEEVLARANPAEGRRVFQRVCASCHRLYGEGGVIGPDLTGSNRGNLDYFLINVLFPSEDVSEAYRLVTLTLRDGRVLTGNVVEQNAKVITFREVGQVQRIDVSEVQSLQTSENSLMPPGMLDILNRDDVRDLIGYLRSTEPLP
jgi:putative membrane-bound dehydrogenase-like protein